MNSEILLIAVIVLPAVAGLLLPLFAARPNVREGTTMVATVLLFGAVTMLLVRVLDGERPALEVLEILPGLSVAFALEPFGMMFATIASGLWIVNSLYSIGYMRANGEPRQTIFYVSFAAAITSTMGIALAGNLFTMFLFYEMLTLVTFPLVTHRGSAEAKSAGRLYLMLLLGASIALFLPAVAWTGVAAGTLDFQAGGILDGKLGTVSMGLLLALFVFGIAKAAVMPMHFWLPAAMVAPTPVSALLHAVAVVKAGVFCIVKIIVYIFGIETLSESGAGDWLVYVAGFTIIAASTIALRQDHLKRRLAYSTVSQLSYVVMGAALLTPIAVLGAAMHIAAHAVSKITLFFAAGSIHTAAHLDYISEMDGAGRRMPWTFGAFTVGALSMIGVPLTAGFLGKWFMLTAAASVEHWFAIGVIVLSTMLNAGYFLPVVYRAFKGERGETVTQREAPWPMVVAVTVTAALTVGMFFYPNIPFALAEALVSG